MGGVHIHTPKGALRSTPRMTNGGVRTGGERVMASPSITRVACESRLCVAEPIAKTPPLVPIGHRFGPHSVIGDATRGAVKAIEGGAAGDEETREARRGAAVAGDGRAGRWDGAGGALDGDAADGGPGSAGCAVVVLTPAAPRTHAV